MTRILLILSVVVLFLLHQDVWNWTRIEPLAFGFLPVGLWYHALFCLAVMGLMWAMVKFAWPSHLEREVESLPEDSSEELRR